MGHSLKHIRVVTRHVPSVSLTCPRVSPHVPACPRPQPWLSDAEDAPFLDPVLRKRAVKVKHVKRREKKSDKKVRGALGATGRLQESLGGALGATGSYWQAPGVAGRATGSCWGLLRATGSYWELLGGSRNHWEGHWELLGGTGKLQGLLGGPLGATGRVLSGYWEAPGIAGRATGRY